MAQCFCGCGLKVGAFAMSTKSANKMGRLVDAELAKIDQAVTPRVEQMSADAEPFKQRVAESIEQGQDWRERCRQVVHGDLSFAAVHWPSLREWVRDSQGMTGFFGLSPEAQQRIMDSTR